MKLLVVLSFAVVCLAQQDGEYYEEPRQRRVSPRRDDYYEDPRAQAYKFGYNTGNDGPAQIFREETKAPDGSIVGKYGYVDPTGQLRVINYRSAPQKGFEASRGSRNNQEQQQQQQQQPLGGNPRTHYVDYPYDGAFQYQELY
ncbi:uncharacterized protein [Centruroides vittatus]|uniref:uncharacterized protein n=1 Tax=Centruroides vittatus TaxID=120091 RepID=UPI00350FFF4D